MIPKLVPRAHLAERDQRSTRSCSRPRRWLGPALAGLVIGTRRRRGGPIALNAISFLFVIAALLMMRDLPVRAHGEQGLDQLVRGP